MRRHARGAYHLLLSGQFGKLLGASADGEMVYEIPSEARNWEGFVFTSWMTLSGSGARRSDDHAALSDSWFFSPPPDSCPATDAVGDRGCGAALEHGVALWNRAEDRIYLLFDPNVVGAWRAFPG